MEAALLQQRLVIVAVAIIANIVLIGWPTMQQLFGLDVLLNWLKRKMGVVERKFNRPNRSRSTRVTRGFLYAFFWLGSLYTLSILYYKTLPNFVYYAPYIDMAILALLLPISHIWARTRGVYGAVIRGNHGRASELARHFWRRTGRPQDDHGILRESIEYLAIGSSRMVMAPLLGYLAFGLFGLLLVHMVALMDEHVGYRSKQYGAFGSWTARIHTLIQFIPARITALFLIIVSAFVPKSNPWRVLSCIASERGKVKSVNSGWPLAAYAGALYVSVGGPRNIVDTRVADGWVGKGSAKVQPEAVRRALYLFALSVLLLWFSLLAGFYAIDLFNGQAVPEVKFG